MSTAINYLLTAISSFLSIMQGMMFHQIENSASFFDIIIYLIFFCIFMFLFRKVVRHG